IIHHIRKHGTLAGLFDEWIPSVHRTHSESQRIDGRSNSDAATLALGGKLLIRRACLCISVLLIAVLLDSHGTEQTQVTPPDTIFYNGHIVTMNVAAPAAQAVAVANGRFLAVGSNDAVRRM